VPTGFVEWRLGRGALPLVLSAPHGGRFAPAEIPDRTVGSKVADLFSLELAQAVWASFPEGNRPALVASLLHRRKLDANRPKAEAAAGNELAEAAWTEYHAALASELRQAVVAHGVALLLDIHGQSHRPATELGYVLSSADLRLLDGELDHKATSLAALHHLRPGAVPLSELIRGSASLGALLERVGFACTPSPGQPCPVTEEAFAEAVAQGLPPPRYFPGNYTTRRYGSPGVVPADENPLSPAEVGAWAGRVAAIQVEAERLVREESNRKAFAAALRDAAMEFLALHAGWHPRPKEHAEMPGAAGF